MSPLAAAWDWFNQRSGFGAFCRRVFDEQIPGGPKWAYAFGRALLLVLLLQAATGILLMFNYVPSAQSAWSSVFYIQYRVHSGWFIRGLHHYGSSAVMIVVGLHLLQTTIYGAYKEPRQVNWWLGLILLALTCGLALTGYSLPWDLKAYWATRVTTSVAGSLPLLGPSIQKFVVGGIDYGQSTISRLFALHVAVLPMLLVLVFLAHFAAFRRSGVTQAAGSLDSRAEPYWPGQGLRDGALALLVVAAISVWVIMEHGAPLDAPADPAVDYAPRPEWYFRWLFELFKLLPPSLEVVAAAAVPVVIGGYLVSLPLLDSVSSRRLRDRWVWVAPVVLIAVGVIGLTLYSMLGDMWDPKYQRVRKHADQRAQRAVQLAKVGIPPDGPLEMLMNDPMTRGRDVYEQQCLQCHVLDGRGKRKAPDHQGFASRQWIMGLLHEPDAPEYFGETEIDDMPSQSKLGRDVLLSITEYLFSLGWEKGDPEPVQTMVAEGKKFFEGKCMGCHVFEGDGDYDGLGGPDLSAYGSREWIYRQTATPQLHYPETNDMPAFEDQLSSHDLHMVSAYLRMQRFEHP